MPREANSERVFGLESQAAFVRTDFGVHYQHCETGPCRGGALLCPTPQECHLADEQRRAARALRVIPYRRAPWWRRLFRRFSR